MLAGDPSAFGFIYTLYFFCYFTYFICKVSKNTSYSCGNTNPHSGITKPTIIPLEGNPIDDELVISLVLVPQPVKKPWAPFQTHVDFEYAESVVRSWMNNKMIDMQLYGMHHGWAQGSNIIFRNYTDMEKSLQAARSCVVQVSSHWNYCLLITHAEILQFQQGSVLAEYQGKKYTFSFQYRDTWALYNG